MIGYYEAPSERYTYSDNITTSTATTGGQWITVTSTSCSLNIAVEYEPPPYRRPKPPYIPFEPVRVPKYVAPPPARPWPVALRRFRGDIM